MLSRRVAVELQYGQRWTAFWSWRSEGVLSARGAGGAKPASGCPACREEYESLRALVGGEQAL